MSQTRMPVPVTVVIPTFNRAALVSECVESVLNQDGVSVAQVIVVDDASTDETAIHAEAAGATVLRLGVNGGAAAARNAGLAAVQTEWVAFLDSDDRWLPTTLHSLWKRSADYSIVSGLASAFSGEEIVAQIGSPTGREVVVSSPLDPLRQKSQLAVSGSIMRTELVRSIGGFSEGLRYSEDLDFWVRILERAPALSLAEPTVLYQRHPLGKSNDRAAVAARIEIARSFAERAWANGATIEAFAGAVMWNAATSGLRKGDRGRAGLMIGRVALRPSRVRGAWRAANHNRQIRRAYGDWPSGIRELQALASQLSHASTALPNVRGMVVVWGGSTTRAQDLAANLGWACHQPGPPTLLGRELPAVLRWLAHAFSTVAALERHRPEAILIQNPPIFAPVVCAAWARARGAKWALDSHPASFGRRQRIWKFFVPLHRRLARKAVGVLVPSAELADIVRSWGGAPAIVHEAPPPQLTSDEQGPLNSDAAARFDVMFAGTFAADEPIEAVLEAARITPDVAWAITGDPRRAGVEPSTVPENVTLVGFLDFARYLDVLNQSRVLASLTDDSSSVSRAAWEATVAGKPLIVSDWPVAGETFPNALRTDNDANAIARAVREALSELEEMSASSQRTRNHLLSSWENQKGAILDFFVEGQAS